MIMQLLLFFVLIFVLSLLLLMHNTGEALLWTRNNPIIIHHHKLQTKSVVLSRKTSLNANFKDLDEKQLSQLYSDRLYSPCAISFNIINNLVERRSEARKQKNYQLADSILRQLKSLETGDTLQKVIRPGYKLFLTDIPLSKGGGSVWHIKLAVPFLPTPAHINENIKEENDEKFTVLQLAHMALGLAIISSSSSNSVANNSSSRHSLIQRAKKRLVETHGTDLYGRSAADAAFWFSLANTEEGEQSELSVLFDYLVNISTNELVRYGSRPSCAPKHILQILERYAAAGLDPSSPSVKNLHSVAADCLEQKINMENADNYDNHNKSLIPIIRSLREGTFDLHSDRSSLLLWKFSTKQRKQRAFVSSASKHASSLAPTTGSSKLFKELPLKKGHLPNASWHLSYNDPNKPMVIDLGCGMGLSMLGLASLSSRIPNITSFQSKEELTESPFFLMNYKYWSPCNFAGVDLSRLAIGYASGVAQRLGLKNEKVNFFVSPAEEFLLRVSKTYPGSVKLIMIQFPTPFRFSPPPLQEEAISTVLDESLSIDEAQNPLPCDRGNSQLPSTSDPTDGFMITKNLLLLASSVLAKGGGHLLVQSNCEDVAVSVRNLAMKEAGFRSIKFCDAANDGKDAFIGRQTRITQRTERYAASGGERAEGDCWSKIPILPKQGTTETEVACRLNGTPIHRCILTPARK